METKEKSSQNYHRILHFDPWPLIPGLGPRTTIPGILGMNPGGGTFIPIGGPPGRPGGGPGGTVKHLKS